MANLKMKNATAKGGASNVEGGGQAPATKQKQARYCGTYHINKVVREIQRAGLGLRNTSAATQIDTLLKVLQHFGVRGLNTYEGQATGYLRIATRIKELKETWEIRSLREDVIGPDGLFHKGVARYVLIGKRKALATVREQQPLDLEAA